MDCNSVLSSRNKHTKVSNTIRKIGLGIATKARQGCESSVLEGVTLTPGYKREYVQMHVSHPRTLARREGKEGGDTYT